MSTLLVGFGLGLLDAGSIWEATIPAAPAWHGVAIASAACLWLGTLLLFARAWAVSAEMR